MRIMLAAAVVSLMLVVPLHAQTPNQPQTPPAAPAQPAPAQPPPAPPAPFPEGAKVAFVDFQEVASSSIEGKAAAAKIQAVNQQKVGELNEKNKQLQALQQKLQQGLTVLSDEARQQLQREIDRTQLEIQRFTQDAQSEVQELQQQLLGDFQRKVMPIVEQVANERGLHMVFTTEAGIAWVHRGLDLSAEVIRRFDTAAKPGGQ